MKITIYHLSRERTPVEDYQKVRYQTDATTAADLLAGDCYDKVARIEAADWQGAVDLSQNVGKAWALDLPEDSPIEMLMESPVIMGHANGFRNTGPGDVLEKANGSKVVITHLGFEPFPKRK